MVLEYAVHIQGSKPVPPFPHASHFATGCVTKSQPFTYALEWIPCRHVLMCLLYFFVLGWRERWKHLNAQNEKHCIIMCASIALVNFFFTAHSFSPVLSWWALFFFFLWVLSSSSAGPMSRERLLTSIFFSHKQRRQTIIFGGVACICGFKIAVCVTLFASSYIISSTTWTSSFCYNSFWFF